MTDESLVLKLQVLMALHSPEEKERTVSYIAKSLALKPYQVSRIMTALESEGLADKSVDRHPQLTRMGEMKAEEYEEKISICITHLLYEGVEEEYARQDAIYWAMNTSEQTMKVLKDANERYRIKRGLRGENNFSGNILCKIMREGDYDCTFVFYRLDPEGGNILSMANQGFENPCKLIVRQGEGTIQLKAVPMVANSGMDGHSMTGEVSLFQYFDGQGFKQANRKGDYISFPANALEFVNCGTGVGQFMTGTAKIKMQCSVGKMHMPESIALFSITI